MKKVLLLFISLLLFSSCSNEDSIVINEMDNTAEVEDTLEDNVEVDESQASTESEIDGRIIPDEPNQTFMVHGQTERVAQAVSHGTCWNDECNIEPTNPREKVLNEARIVVDKGEEITINMILPLEIYSEEDSNNRSNLIYPYEYELIHFSFHDEEGTVVDTKPGAKQYEFTAPEEKGTHFYLLHVIWDEGMTKHVYYGFALYVKE